MEDHKLSLYDNIAKVNAVDPELYERYPAKRGLRNSDGSGVIAGVTNISNVHGYLMNEGDKVPDEGKLTFRGYSIYDLVGGDATKRRGFEEIVYLLLMGELPTSSQLDVLVEALDAQRNLPDGFTALGEHAFQHAGHGVGDLGGEHLFALRVRVVVRDVAVLVELALAHLEDDARLGLLLCVMREDEATCGGFLSLVLLDDDAITERLKIHSVLPFAIQFAPGCKRGCYHGLALNF